MTAAPSWADLNSPIDPDKLHAIGATIAYLNFCEHQWEELLWSYLRIQPQTAHLLTRGMPLGQVLESMSSAVATDEEPEFTAVIENTIAITKVCNANRNKLVHFQISFGGNLLGARNAKVIREFQVTEDDLASIRRVAEDIKALHLRLHDLYWYLAQRRGGPVRNATLPRILPEPRHLASRKPSTNG